MASFINHDLLHQKSYSETHNSPNPIPKIFKQFLTQLENIC